MGRPQKGSNAIYFHFDSLIWKQPWTRRLISDRRSEGDYFVIMNSFEMTLCVYWYRPRLTDSLKGDVKLIFSFLVFLSRNEMFTRFPSQWLLNRRAAVVRQSDSVGEFKSGAETHLFSTASQPVLEPTFPDFFFSFFHVVYFLQSVIDSL